MTDMTPDHAQKALADIIDDVVPGTGYQLTPLVGLGGSAGAIPAMRKFLQTMPADSGLAFVVILHLAPDHESNLAEILQRCTTMPVIQACDSVEVQPNAVYVIPPRKAIRTVNGHLSLADDTLSPRGRHVAVDLFFRTLADAYGPQAAAVVLSGADGDGAIGIKRIKERGGLTVAQDPQDAEQAGMPRSAIASGMVDWVLPVEEIAQRLLAYFGLAKSLKLPPEDGPHPAQPPRPAAGSEEAALRDVLAFLRTRTGRDFSYYKRATVVRRIARRMQVNGVEDLQGYLDYLRTRPGEAGALLQDMLISVTNFFRDADCFRALEDHLDELCRSKGPNDALRIWVPACATGEEAYSLAMLLCDKARQMEAPPLIQVFATDLDEEAIKAGREGVYPSTIDADVSDEHLRRYFARDHRGYRVRRELREMVLFAQHDLLKDSPFSRLDLISCRNLLIYLNRDAQKRAFEIFHFALLPEGKLFLGASESAEDVGALFSVLDKKNRIFAQRPTPRMPLPLPAGRGSLALANSRQAESATPRQAEQLESAGADPVAHHLDRELERLKAHLRDTVEQYEASNEELKASNEELQAMNEELTTVNYELKSKVDELGHSNGDMHNLMDATAIATVFLAVVASSSDAIMSFAMDQTILSWNAGAERIFGYSAAEAIGRRLSMLGPEEKDERQREQMLRQLREGNAISNLEVTRQRKDGSDVMVALSVSPIKDTHDKVIGGTAIARDITRQNQAAEALRSSEERLRLVVENATEYAIFSTDLRRRVTIWNAGAQRLLGYAESEVLGKPADIIFTPEDRALGAPEHEMRSALQEGRASDDRLHQRKDGSRFWASGALMLMRDAQGQAVGFVKILRDQTAARETQQALECSQAELMRALEENEDARAELQAADAAKDRFLAVLSHELRNPLASIDSAAALMLTQGLPLADRESAAQVVNRQARAMMSLLDDLLDVSRLKLGRLQLQRESVRLTSVVEAALETTRPMLEAVGHRLKVDLPAYPIDMDADPLRMGQVISNLLTNSIKYTQAGGTISLKARLEGKQAVISVCDNGMGMDPAHIERMFEMFAQEQPVADRSHGLGIGLALAKSIMEMHGGSIEAFSAGSSKGSEFRVTLPAARGRADGADAQSAGAVAAASPPAQANHRGLILIADDNVDAGWGIAKLLEIAGFSTVRVKGGVEAVKETRRQKPDVGIVDIGMPDLSGHEVARQIRQTEWGKRMVLVAATGWGQESDEREAIEAGFDVHMTKPVDLRKLSAVVDELLLRRRG